MAIPAVCSVGIDVGIGIGMVIPAVSSEACSVLGWCKQWPLFSQTMWAGLAQELDNVHKAASEGHGKGEVQEQA